MEAWTISFFIKYHSICQDIFKNDTSTFVTIFYLKKTGAQMWNMFLEKSSLKYHETTNIEKPWS